MLWINNNELYQNGKTFLLLQQEIEINISLACSTCSSKVEHFGELWKMKKTYICIMPPRELGIALHDPDLQFNLFPQGFIIINWEAFRVSKESNLACIEKWIADGKIIARATHPETQVSNAKPGVSSISFTTPAPCKNGLHFNMNYFGKYEEDSANHVMDLIQYGREITGCFVIKLQIPLHMDIEKVISLLNGNVGVRAKESLNWKGKPRRLLLIRSPFEDELQKYNSKL